MGAKGLAILKNTQRSRQVRRPRRPPTAPWEFIARSISIPDIVRNGGISEMRKIATMTESYNVPVSPHDATDPITMPANTQVMISTPNFHRLEIAYSELPHYNTAPTLALDFCKGIYHVPKTPRLRHTLNPDYIAAAAGKSLID